MKEYDYIAVGTGSAMSIVSALLSNSEILPRIAVVENKTPGGICLTRGCIPSKMILYPAELLAHMEDAKAFGLDIRVKNVDFSYIMKRMRGHIDKEVDQIRKGLSNSEYVDFYPEAGTFVDDYTLKVGDQTIRSEKIILGSGSRPLIPPIDGLEDVDYLTSETFLNIENLPKSTVIVGGGYIAAEYGFFLSKMGSRVTIIGRNSQFVPEEEEAISSVLRSHLSKHIDIYTGFEVTHVEDKRGKKTVYAKSADGREIEVKANEILIATGRRSNSDILRPDKTGVKTDEHGWIQVNEYMETSKPGIWSLGDAIGKYMFKHVANHEAEVVYRNILGDTRVKADYHAVPHAIFTYPEVASVGMKESEAKEDHEVMIGHYKYEDTAKGSAMGAKDYFVKVVVEKKTYRILGAHIIGPHASILIQEIVNLMYTSTENVVPIYRGMHIHPALSEVVQRAFSNLHSH